MNLLAPISSIMTTRMITVKPSDTMKKVEEIFRQNSIHHIPVLEDGKLVGIVSKSDYLFFKRGFVDQNTDALLDLYRLKVWKVGKVMTTKLAKMDVNDRVNVALEVFRVNRFHAILVTDEDRLVGIVTTHDIIENLARAKMAVSAYS